MKLGMIRMTVTDIIFYCKLVSGDNKVIFKWYSKSSSIEELSANSIAVGSETMCVDDRLEKKSKTKFKVAVTTEIHVSSMFRVIILLCVYIIS